MFKPSVWFTSLSNYPRREDVSKQGMDSNTAITHHDLEFQVDKQSCLDNIQKAQKLPDAFRFVRPPQWEMAKCRFVRTPT